VSPPFLQIDEDRSNSLGRIGPTKTSGIQASRFGRLLADFSPIFPLHELPFHARIFGCSAFLVFSILDIQQHQSQEVFAALERYIRPSWVSGDI
jgi:hypothetical protein